MTTCEHEERALFPFIVNKSFLTDGVIERLALDHEEIDAHWAKLNEVLRAAIHTRARDVVKYFTKT